MRMLRSVGVAAGIGAMVAALPVSAGDARAAVDRLYVLDSPTVRLDGNHDKAQSASIVKAPGFVE